MSNLMRTPASRLFRCYAVVVTAAALLLPSLLQAQPAAPAITSLQPFSIAAGEQGFNLVVTGRNFDAGSIVIWGSQPLTSSATSTTEIVAAVPAALITTPGNVGIIVRSGFGTLSNLLTFTVLPSSISIATSVLPQAQAGVAYSQQLEAAGGTAPYTWTVLDALPAGLALSQAGQLSGTPTTTGSFTFNVRATDAVQRSATKTLSLTVSVPPFSITNAETLPPATETVAYEVALVVTNGTRPFRWAVGQGLPAGLTLDATSGILRGTPTTRGTYTFTVQVSDAANQTASKSFSLSVRAAPLTISTLSPLFGGTLESPYTQTFSATGGTPPYSWSMRPDVPGLTLAPASGVLSGTPTQAGTYNITVQATDAAGATATKEFSLRVEQLQLRILNTATLPQATVETSYQYRFLASGGRQPYSWIIAPGSLPGLVIDTVTGVLSGTPSAPGTFNFSVQLRDAANDSTSRTFTLTIGAGPLQLSAVSDPMVNTVGTQFSFTPSASGGTTPYTWTANGLPEGLSIDVASGQISGISATVGSFLFTVRVTDASRASVTELYRLEIVAPTLPRLTAPGVVETSRPADQVPLQLELASAYSLPLTGQLTLAFSPETGSGDPAIQFSSGGRTLEFRIPAGATRAEFTAPSAALQTGTVAGTITLSARLQTQGASITPTPIAVHTIRVERTAPVISSATFSRTGSTIEIRVTGYSNSREVTQAVFRFQASPGNTLTTSEVTVPLEEMFGRWYRDTESTAFGGQFTFTQQFTIQGDASLVTPTSVTLSNRIGSTQANVRQ